MLLDLVLRKSQCSVNFKEAIASIYGGRSDFLIEADTESVSLDIENRPEIDTMLYDILNEQIELLIESYETIDLEML